MQTYVYRSMAVEQARAQGWVAFRTLLDKTSMWKANYERGENPADEYAKANPEWCSHGEVSWAGGSSDEEGPYRVGVIVAKVPFDELSKYAKVAVDRAVAKVWIYPNDRLGHNPPHKPFLCEPMDSERWPIFTAEGAKPVKHDPREVHPGDEQPKRTAAAPAREPSTAGSPTKKVWEIADSMPDASRADVVAKCLEAGINKNTAGTQYSHWKRARSGQG